MKPASEPAKPAAWSRWLHLYLSILRFLAVLFFAVMGLPLSYVEWFDGA